MPIKKGPNAQRVEPGIWQDGERFIARVGWSDPKTGRRKERERVVGSLEDARAFRANPNEYKDNRPTRTKFRDFATSWLQDHVRDLRLSSKERYTRDTAFLIVHFGDLFVDAIESRDIRIWRDAQRGDYAPATVNGWIRVLRIMLDRAVEDGDLPQNPARRVKTLPERRTKGARGRALSAPQLRAYLSALDELGREKILPPDVARHLAVIAWTGIRRGEAIALCWSDYVAGELRIERSVYKTEVNGTKTDDPRRIAVVEPLAEVLEAQRKWLLEVQHPGLDSGLMFPADPRHAKAGATRRGDETITWFRAPNVLADGLKEAIAHAKVPEVTLHSFRRTFENLGRAAGVDRLVRKSLSGWRTDTAQEIYAEVSSEERAEAGAALVRLVLGNAGP